MNPNLGESGLGPRRLAKNLSLSLSDEETATCGICFLQMKFI